MHIVDAERLLLYDAMEIAVGYLVQSGYGKSEANVNVIKHIVPLFNAGEHRPLVLANRVISAIERARVEDDTRRVIALCALFKEHG